jgi:hypothetical protein
MKNHKKIFQKEWLSKQSTIFLLYLRRYVWLPYIFPVDYPIDENSEGFVHSGGYTTYQVSNELLYAELANRPHFENNKKLRKFTKKSDKKRLKPNWTNLQKNYDH